MSPEKTPRRVVKATMEAVFQAQEQLRKHVTELSSNNRVIRDESERDLFFRELAYATLGFGVDEIIDNIPGINEIDVETLARVLAMKTDTKFVDEKYNTEITIGEAWSILLSALFSVYPIALSKAVSMSKERDEQTKSKGYVVDGSDD